MKFGGNSVFSPHRRSFTKRLVIAAMSAPLLSSIACRRGPEMKECCPAGTFEEHIPPMGIDGGGGSLIVESRNKLTEGGTRLEYVEEGIDNPDRYGELDQLRVISELLDPPYVRDVRYTGFPDGCALLLWYQRIKPGQECQYDFETPYPAQPDVHIIGGHKDVRFYKMTVTNKQLTSREPSFKCGRPHRYKHPDHDADPKHFRLGRWRVVRADGSTIFEDSTRNTGQQRPEHFHLYVTFRHYQLRR